MNLRWTWMGVITWRASRCGQTIELALEGSGVGIRKLLQAAIMVCTDGLPNDRRSQVRGRVEPTGSVGDG